MPLLSRFALVCLTGVCAFAQSYQFPSAEKRFKEYARTTFGPFSLLTTGVSAGIQHIENAPPEWGHGGGAYGMRYADVFGRTLVQNTIEYGAAEVLREDPVYYRCECAGLWRRTGHALTATFTARRASGKRTLAVSSIAGAYAGGLVSTLWYPARYSWKDGVRIGSYGFGSNFAVNLATEFWPDVRRKVFGK